MGRGVEDAGVVGGLRAVGMRDQAGSAAATSLAGVVSEPMGNNGMARGGGWASGWGGGGAEHHLVDTGLEQCLVVRVDGLGEQPCHAQLVDVQGRNMAVVEDEWLAQLVVGLHHERRLVLDRRKQELSQRPRVVEVVQPRLPRTGGVEERRRVQRAGGGVPAWAMLGSLAGPPPRGARTGQLGIDVAALPHDRRQPIMCQLL